MQKKILFVDDESSLRRTMTLGLRQHGYDTEPCENGVNALKKLESYIKNNIPLDGIVVDLKLPDIDGIKLVKILKFKCPGVPIIVITGYADRYNLDQINSLQVSAFLEKPFSADELSQQFVEIMAKQQAVKESPAAKTDTAPVQTAYLLLKLDEEQRNFFEMFRDIYYLKDISPYMVYCDAVKGDYDIFMLLQADQMETLREITDKRIAGIPGVKSVDFLEVGNPVLSENTLAVIKDAEDALEDENSPKLRDMGQRVCSYILAEVEKEKLDDIYPTLRLDSNVVYCDYTAGRYNLVLLVTGSYFDEIDKFINRKVIGMEGVLKVKEYPIINLFEM